MTLPDEPRRGATRRQWSPGSGFVMVHLDAVDALDGSWDAAALLNRIEYRAGAGWWAASRADMQAELRMTEHRVKVALRLLRDRGMVRARRASSFDATLEWRPWYDDEEDPDLMEPDAVSVMEPDAVTEVERDAVSTVPREHEERNPPLVPPSGDGEIDQQPALLDVDTPQQPALVVAPDDGFDRFWAAYPRKVGKGAARKAWPKALAKVGGDVSVIAEGFRRALPAWQQRKARGEERFIPHPSTWLNEERWHDDAPQVERTTTAPAGSLAVMLQSAKNAAEGRYVDPWEYAKGLAGSGPQGLDSPAPGHPALPANERNRA